MSLALIGDVVSKSGDVRSARYALLPALLLANRFSGVRGVFMPVSLIYTRMGKKKSSHLPDAYLLLWFAAHVFSRPMVLRR
jgi:hypothetical protein